MNQMTADKHKWDGPCTGNHDIDTNNLGNMASILRGKTSHTHKNLISRRSQTLTCLVTHPDLIRLEESIKGNGRCDAHQPAGSQGKRVS